MTTKIEWATDSWNPIQAKIKGKTGRGYHCTKISPGCANCYAEATNILRGNGLPFDNRATDFELVTKTLEAPLHWRKPRRVFVQSMGDLFHEGISFWLIAEVFRIIKRSSADHQFLILTKRPERLKKFIVFLYDTLGLTWPNVWLGVTAENQEQADKRIPLLLGVPVAVRFVSYEPALGPLDIKKTIKKWKFDQFNLGNTKAIGEKTIDWVICGGESGPNARPMHPDWARSVRDQCQAADVPFFFKQWGEYRPQTDSRGKTIYFKVGKKKAGRALDGREWNEYPEVQK